MGTETIFGNKDWPELALVVDDEIDNCETLRFLLDKISCRSIIASNGKTALEVLGEYPGINLIITDISMPEMNGIEFLKEIRKRGIAAPVIVISAYGNPQTLRDIWREGAYDFIDKPFDFKETSEKISLALKFGAGFNPSDYQADESKITSVNINSNLWQKLQWICASKGLKPDRELNRIIARYLGTTED